MIENKIQYYKILNNFIHKNHNNKTILQIFNEFIQSQTIIRPDITFIGFFNFMSLFGYESYDGLFRLYTDDNRATINSDTD
jgi:transcriptional regulatory protein LevR